MQRFSSVVSLLFAVGIFCLPGEARAQTGDRAGAGGGRWWTVSTSAHGSRLSCDLCDPGRDVGPAIGLAAGTYASPNTRVGLDVGYATTEQDGTRESIWSAGVGAELHPRPGSGLHLIGGLGWTGYRAGDFTYDAVRLRLGLGWDLPLAGSWVVGNRLVYDASSFGTLSNDGAPVVEAVGLGTVRFGMYIGRRRTP